jgi:hypothetical protein
MNTRDFLQTKTARSTVLVRSQTHFIPVRFELPENLKETMPATKVMAIEGQLTLIRHSRGIKIEMKAVT